MWAIEHAFDTYLKRQKTEIINIDVAKLGLFFLLNSWLLLLLLMKMAYLFICWKECGCVLENNGYLDASITSASQPANIHTNFLDNKF